VDSVLLKITQIKEGRCGNEGQGVGEAMIDRFSGLTGADIEWKWKTDARLEKR
jgi:hypothetical protein